MYFQVSHKFALIGETTIKTNAKQEQNATVIVITSIARVFYCSNNPSIAQANQCLEPNFQ